MAKAEILIVEDDGVVARDIQNRLKNLGFGAPTMVPSGEEAIEKVKEHKPDLVLMDIMLKGEMNGIEAAGQIRSQFNVPVVYLTAYADEKRNWVNMCNDCARDNDERWQEMWDSLYC